MQTKLLTLPTGLSTPTHWSVHPPTYLAIHHDICPSTPLYPSMCWGWGQQDRLLSSQTGKWLKEGHGHTPRQEGGREAVAPGLTGRAGPHEGQLTRNPMSCSHRG